MVRESGDFIFSACFTVVSNQFPKMTTLRKQPVKIVADSIVQHRLGFKHPKGLYLPKFDLCNQTTSWLRFINTFTLNLLQKLLYVELESFIQ